ncbi:hypothetical protein [Rhodococcoides fascians]|uniref:hypothetical protein n=1 Tax=Rhodococcoides fascians TaxID=1828 RepID=UPI0012D369EB|nr:hypothetical protein [Rhodococcus fascians]
MTEPIEPAETYASPQYVLDLWIGADKPTSSELVQRYLTEAEVLLLNDRELSDLEDRLESDEEGAKLIPLMAIAERRMVTRAMKNPDNQRQVNTTTGPYTDSVTLASESFAGLEVTSEEYRLLAKKSSRGAGTASTLPSGVPDHPLVGAWVNGPDQWAPGQDWWW